MGSTKMCVWAPLGQHILDLENGAGREEKKEASNTFVLYGLQKGPNLQIPIDESVCACLVVLFLGWCKLFFSFFWGTQAKLVFPLGCMRVDRASKGTNFICEFHDDIGGTISKQTNSNCSTRCQKSVA